MKLSLKFGLIVFLFSSLALSQNSHKADSIVRLLKIGSFSEDEEFKMLADIAYYHPNLDSALLFAKKSRRLAVTIENPTYEAEALEEISHLERRLGNNEKSFEASLKALQIYEQKEMQERVAASYNQIAVNHMMDANYGESIQYLKKAIPIYEESNKLGHQTNTLLNLGEAYRLAGHLDSASISFKNVLQLNKVVKSEITQGYALGNLGMVHNAQGSLGMAQIELVEAIDILSPLGDPYSTSVYLAELGQVYQKGGRNQQAEKQLLEALNMAQEAGLKEQIRDISATLTHFYENQGEFENALIYQKQFQVYQDSLVNKENVKKIEQLKAGYEIDKRESQIGLLNTINSNQRYLLFTLGGGILLVLLFTYLLYKANRNIKKANQTLSEQKEIIAKREQEKAILLKELNHRVKNNLQMVSSLLNLQSSQLHNHPAKEAILAGKDRVEALSLVHRKLYQEGTDTKINAKDYIEELVLDLCHGYNAAFEPEFDIEDVDLNIDTAIPLALIVNELVVNALKYAFKNVKKPVLKVAMVKNTTLDVALFITDNGIGFKSKPEAKRESFGLKLIHSLVKQLEGTIEKINAPGTHWKINFSIS